MAACSLRPSRLKPCSCGEDTGLAECWPVAVYRGRRIARVYGNRTVSSFSLSCIVSIRLLADGFAGSLYPRPSGTWMEPRPFCAPMAVAGRVWSIARGPTRLSKCRERRPRQRKGEHNKDELAGPARLSIAESCTRSSRHKQSRLPNSRTMWSSTPISCGSPCENNACRMSLAHHGNLSREIREETEAALKRPTVPLPPSVPPPSNSGSTLDLSNGSSKVGSPPSVASLRQRLGRSGRRQENR